MIMHTLRKYRGIAALLALLGIALIYAVPPTTPLYAASNWQATYWNNRTLTGNPVLSLQESAINYDWGGGSPAPGVNSDNFSVRWERTVTIDTPGTYRFSATMDDGMRVYVNGNPIIDAWYDSAVHTVTADIYLHAGNHNVKVEYYEAGGLAVAKLNWQLVTAAEPPITNWRGEYFNNVNLSGAPVLVRDDPQINFNWGYGAPALGVAADNFSVRWTRTINLEPGRYRFTAASDDGMRVFVNNQIVINAWYDRAIQTNSVEIDLPGGPTALRVEYYERTLLAEARFTWTKVAPGTGGPYPTATINTSYLNVRSGPGVGYNIVTTTTRGVVVALSGYRNADTSWVQITLPSGVSGWVNARYLNTTYPLTSLPVWPGSAAPQPTAMVTAYHLNVRSGPGVSYGVVAQAHRNQTVTLAGYRNADASWVQITTPGGVTGWVNARYLSSSFPFTSLAVWTGAQPSLPTATVTAYHLNVRYGPGVGYSAFAQVHLGQVVTLAGYRNADASWVQIITASGARGWVNARYLSSTFPFANLAVWSG